MVGSLKSQNDMNVVGLGKISDFSSHVFGCSSFVAIAVQNGRVEFIVDQIDKLVVVLYTSCRDDYFFGAESWGLELLDHVGSEVVDVWSQSVNGIAQIASAESCLVDVVLEDFVAAQESFQLVGVGILIHTNACGDEVLGLESTVSDHWEDIYNIVGQAVGMIVTILTIVFHLELTSSHLSDTIVDCFTGVDGSLEIGVFKGQAGSSCFWGLVSASNINEDAKVDVGGNVDRFGQDGDSVGELSGIVLEGLSVGDSAFGADGSVDGSPDQGLVAVWVGFYVLDLKREKRHLDFEMILFIYKLINNWASPNIDQLI